MVKTGICVKKPHSRERVWFCFFFAAYTAASFFLFFRQAGAGADGAYLSDMPHYIGGVLGTNDRDPYPYRLFFWTVAALMKIMPVNVAAAAAVTLFNSITVFVIRHYIRKYLRILPRPGGVCLPAAGGSGGLFSRFWRAFPKETVLLFCCLMASMLILPIPGVYKFPGQYYIGQGTGNMWHNATHLATRPFAVAAFFSFWELIRELPRGVNPKKAVLFSASLLLTTFAKPTFTAVFFPAAGTVMAAVLIRSRGRGLKRLCLLALCFLPAAADLMRQYLPLFGAEGGGIALLPGAVWGEYTVSIALSVLLCFAFEISVLVPRIGRIRELPLLGGVWVFTAAALAEGVLLAELGGRMADGNFLQGYQHMMFFNFAVSAVVWFRELSAERLKTPSNLISGTLFLWHTASGIFYFVRLLLGYKFY